MVFKVLLSFIQQKKTILLKLNAFLFEHPRFIYSKVYQYFICFLFFFAVHFIWRQFPPVDNSTIVINKVIVIKSFFRIQTLLSTGHVINTKLNEVKMATIFFTNTSRGKGFENSINLRGF